MPNCADMILTIVNYDEMVDDCKAILELCYLLGMPSDEWVTEYLCKYIKFYMGVR